VPWRFISRLFNLIDVLAMNRNAAGTLLLDYADRAAILENLRKDAPEAPDSVAARPELSWNRRKPCAKIPQRR
jgi:hypothetical protein